MSWNRGQYQNAPNRDVEDEPGLAAKRKASAIRGLGITSDFGTSRNDQHTSIPPDGKHAIRRVPVPSTPNLGALEGEPSRKSAKHNVRTVAWERLEERHSPFSADSGSSVRGLLSPSNQHLESESASPKFGCQTENAIIEGRWTWLSATVMILAVYSTVFSAIYLGIALARPRYGKKIGIDGHMAATSASILSTTLAKTIELSFVSVFVAFLGQVLSRRAIRGKVGGGGVSIAEMMMRTWVMQPGTLITHRQMVGHVGLTFLGTVTLIVTVMAMFYVTAAEALVSPKLRMGRTETKLLHGKVAAGFANPTFLADKCPSPVQDKDDPLYKGTTCLQIQHASNAYSDYELFLQGWARNLPDTNLSGIDYTTRSPPIGTLYGNTTIHGQWITPSGENITADSMKHARLVQNLTMAMPHANVFNAARDPLNGILQPEYLNHGQGEYIIKASVPAPTVNILCAGVTGDDIKALIYTEWPTYNNTTDLKNWPLVPNMIYEPAYPNATAIDELFDFGPDPGDKRQRAPLFPKLPIPYNTILNGSASYPAHSIYLLAGSPSTAAASPYLFCSLRAMQYPNCTTRYRAINAGGSLTVHCHNDPENTLPYNKSRPDAPSGGQWEPDWKNVASEWARSLSLGTGISDANSSNGRLLTQMIPQYDATSHEAFLSPSLPSIGEALGVLSGSNLLLSSLWSPFIHYWQYHTGTPLLGSPANVTFNASLAYRDYASGATDRWQGIFFIVLMVVFLTNCFCLVYLAWTIRGEGQVTDYTEPQNLFALAVNSPPSQSLSGACGAGPEGKMLVKKWEVEMEKPPRGALGHPHFYVRCGDDEPTHSSSKRKFRRKSGLSWKGMHESDVDKSPAVEQYEMIANKRKSFL